MKTLIETYLSEQGIPTEPYKVQFLRFTTKIYRDENGDCCVEFPKWNFNCPPPSFTPQEIENELKQEYIDSYSDGINVKYAEDEITKQSKLNELTALTSLEDIKDYTY